MISRKLVNASFSVHGTGKRFVVSHLLIGPKGPGVKNQKMSVAKIDPFIEVNKTNF